MRPGAARRRSGVDGDFGKAGARVIQQMLGLPEQDITLLHQLTKTLAAPEDPELGDASRPASSMFESIPVFTEYFLKVIEDRRRNPRDYISTILANGKVNALSSEVLRQLHTIAIDLTEHPPGAVVVTGGARVFAAGADISEFGGPVEASAIGACCCPGGLDSKGVRRG